ncbi:Aste57867_17397 [Aphanomyces stellatus]|uniref:Amino acid transporter n=1 Tax=Aphanomyces stellatus TaxID=120398 RepID=A0A485L9G7_9STRA|nr:hypothetical protein As57867_017337 [Aphanomyces stellatus]VFT94153.1 Aste57867_17397 [Aphanomyces stellatus]
MSSSKPGIYLYGDGQLENTRRTDSTDSLDHVTDGYLGPQPRVTAANHAARTNFLTSSGVDLSMHPTEFAKFKPPPSTILGGDARFDDDDDDDNPREPDFGPVAPRLHVKYIAAGLVVGVGLGVLFYYVQVGAEWRKLVRLPGQLFVGALTCLVEPLVFCVLTIVVAETVALGRSSILRWRTLLPYAISSVLATTQGVVLALLFQSTFVSTTTPATILLAPSPPFNLTLQCANGLFVAPMPTGTLGCIEANGTTTARFIATAQGLDTRANTVSSVSQLSIIDQVITLANLLVPSNIFYALVSGQLLSIVTFSIPLGFAIARSAADGQDNLVLHILRQLRNVFMYLLHGLLWLTPVAIVFLLGDAACSLEGTEIQTVASHILALGIALVAGSLFHTFVVLPLLLYAWTRTHPYQYISHLFPAYIFAFGCASSMATLPVAIACIQDAKVSRSLAHIAMPFGTPINLNGSGLYYPLAVVFMASISGLSAELTSSRWCLVFLVSLFGAMGTAPVPNAALVYLATLWATCFAAPLPSSFSVILAADFIFDRIRTMVNVNGNCMVTRILADEVDETFEVHAAQHVG